MQQDFLYIYKVYEEGSFSRAAEKLFITQPALSIAIQKIEQSIGMPLFDRSHRPLKLTAAGEIYINSIKHMMSLEQDLNQQIADICNLKTGTIRIGGSHYLNAYILPDLLQQFNRQYPGIQLQLIEAGSNDLALMLSEHKLDLTFSCNTAFVNAFEKYPFFHDQILLAVPEAFSINSRLAEYALSAADIISKKHLRSDCPVAPFDCFRDLDYILLSEGNHLHNRAFQLFQAAGFSPRVKLQLSQLVTAYHLAAAEFGATFISDRIIRTADVPLRFYKLAPRIADRLFYILLPHNSYASTATRTFIRFLLDAESQKELQSL